MEKLWRSSVKSIRARKAGEGVSLTKPMASRLCLPAFRQAAGVTMHAHAHKHNRSASHNISSPHYDGRLESLDVVNRISDGSCSSSVSRDTQSVLVALVNWRHSLAVAQAPNAPLEGLSFKTVVCLESTSSPSLTRSCTFVELCLAELIPELKVGAHHLQPNMV